MRLIKTLILLFFSFAAYSQCEICEGESKELCYSDVAATLTNPTGGIYVIEVTDANGCVATCSFEITASDLEGQIDCN